jgi:hypothetical protein
MLPCGKWNGNCKVCDMGWLIWWWYKVCLMTDSNELDQPFKVSGWLVPSGWSVLLADTNVRTSVCSVSSSGAFGAGRDHLLPTARHSVGTYRLPRTIWHC